MSIFASIKNFFSRGKAPVAKSGFRQTIKASRVNASMPTEKDMNRVLNTLTL